MQGTSAARADDTPFEVVIALFALTAITGLIDAVSYLGLGHVFTANMTGNVIFVGFALGGAAGMSVVRPLVALAAFGAGSVFGGRMTSSRPRSAAGHLSIAVWAETVLLGAAAVVTFAAGGAESAATRYAVIVLTAVAMGLRNAVVRKLAVPDLTTTVLTLTVTGLAADSRIAGGTGPRTLRRVLAILTMCGGALAGAVLLRPAGVWAPLAIATLADAGLAAYLNPRAVPAPVRA
jgi:uncharacterized membrane protein YoaK (UPF0700 family)